MAKKFEAMRFSLHGAFLYDQIMSSLRIACFLLAAAGLSASAWAQDMPIPSDPQGPRDIRYDVQNMNFDMWCQEEQHLPPARCDKRLPEDDADFNAYRAKIERYEIPYLQQQQKQLQINSNILHNDPVDHPNRPSQPDQQPQQPLPPR
jgi:hypothetical protein